MNAAADAVVVLDVGVDAVVDALVVAIGDVVAAAVVVVLVVLVLVVAVAAVVTIDVDAAAITASAAAVAFVVERQHQALEHIYQSLALISV